MDGFCVGEPWNAVAVAQDIGFTHLTTQDLWLHHPEKALVVNEKTSTEKGVMTALIGGTLEACKWLDDLDNRKEAADHDRRPRLRERSAGRDRRAAARRVRARRRPRHQGLRRHADAVLPGRQDHGAPSLVRVLGAGAVPAARPARRSARPTRRSSTPSSCATSTRRSPGRRASTSPTTTWRRSRSSSTTSSSTRPRSRTR